MAWVEGLLIQRKLLRAQSMKELYHLGELEQRNGNECCMLDHRARQINDRWG